MRCSPYIDYYRPGVRALNLFMKYSFKLDGRSVWVQLNADNLLRDERTINEVSFTNRSTYAVGMLVVLRLTNGVRF